MEHKNAFGCSGIKSIGAGTATAIFSRFGGAPDHDGDITMPSAFTDGQVVPISAWGHASWQPGHLPVGKATIRVMPEHAEADLEFAMETIAGRETFLTLKALVQSEFSYGYTILDSSPGEYKGARVRVLNRLAVHEISPTLVGAGRDTGLVGLRSAVLAEFGRYVARTRGLVPSDDSAARELMAREQMRFIARRCNA